MWAQMTRILFFFSLIFSVFTLTACNKAEQPAIEVKPVDAVHSSIRIGYQRSSTLMTLLKESGELEQELAKYNVKVNWHEFTSGQPLLEALNVGSIDVSADVADTVPVFAQAAKAELTYYAKETASPHAQAILVPQNSKIKTLVDLKGKKIAVTKAAGSHYLLIAALNKAGLSFKDIQPAWLSPADGRAAFEHGGVDAWVTWEPYVSSGTVIQHAKILGTGEGLASYTRYYLTTHRFAGKHPEVLKLIIVELQKKAQWVKEHPDDAARILSPLWGDLPQDVVLKANANRSYNVQPVIVSDMAEQQKIADTFYSENLIPKTINAKNSDIFQ
ncbi:aliphatic sulfonate ABC transporter substrate-binding protein [Acinetobacter sp. NPDC052428]